jgi:hypothetical protein
LLWRCRIMRRVTVSRASVTEAPFAVVLRGKVIAAGRKMPVSLRQCLETFLKSRGKRFQVEVQA